VTRDADGNVLEDRYVAWSSSNASAATVSQGLVTGVAQGQATITATSEEKTASATVTVTQVSAIIGVALWPPNPSLDPGQRIQFYAAVERADGSRSCAPSNPSLDPDVLFNGNDVAGCDSAKALLSGSGG
jgi:hypothetical protein